MLCVSAVNPFLSSKVPALNRIMSIRKRITIMLPYVRCPFRKTLNKGLSSRRYLLESTDFFALRDLIDLSKGPFAGEFIFLNQGLKFMHVCAHADTYILFLILAHADKSSLLVTEFSSKIKKLDIDSIYL